MPAWLVTLLFSLQHVAAQDGLLRVPLFKQQRTTAETPELLLGRYQNDPKSDIPLINYMDSQVCVLHRSWAAVHRCSQCLEAVAIDRPH